VDNSGDSDDPRLQELTEEYQDLLNAGLDPSIEEFVARAPDLAEPLRQRLQAIQALRSLAGPVLPEKIPPYKLVRRLGRGQFGEVHEAVDEITGLRVALKILFPGSGPDPDAWQREIQSIGVLRHTNIVQYHHAGVVGGRLYFAMSFVDGHSLEDELKALKGETDPPQEPHFREYGTPAYYRAVATLGLQIANALSYANGSWDIFHCDVKPSNILLERTREGYQGCLTDFGLVRRGELPERPADHEPGGSPAYTAPERFHGDNNPAGIDVYSLGVTLYELVKLTRPYGTEEIKGFRETLPGADVRSPRLRTSKCRVPLDLEAIIRKAIEPNQTNRYQTAQQLADDLARFLAGQPVAARPRRLLERWWDWGWGKPREFALSLGTLVLFIGIVTTFFVFQWRFGVQEALKVTETLVNEADHAAERGDFVQALKGYQAALDRGGTEPNPIRVKRLACYLALNDRDRLAPELTALETAPDLDSRARARVELVRADASQTAQSGRGSGMQLFEELAKKEDLLDPWDLAFVKGVLSRRFADSETHYRASLKEKRFHHRANCGLTIALFSQGKLVEAREQGRFMQNAFKSDPFPLFVDLLIDLCEGPTAEFEAKTARFGDLLGADRAGPLLEFVAGLREILDLLEIENNRRGTLTFAQRTRLQLVLVPRLTKVTVAASGPLGFPMPGAASLMEKIVFDAGRGTMLLAMGWSDAARKELQKLMNDWPDVIPQHLLVITCWAELGAALRKNDDKTVGAKLREISDLAETSAPLPSLLPRMAWGYETQLFGLLAELALQAEHPALHNAARLKNFVARVERDSDRFPASYVLLISTFTPGLRGDLGRRLLIRVQELAPKKAEVHLARAEFEWREGDAGQTIRNAQRASECPGLTPALRKRIAKLIEQAEAESPCSHPGTR
jgi:serine/threonine protein kinase